MCLRPSVAAFTRNRRDARFDLWPALVAFLSIQFFGPRSLVQQEPGIKRRKFGDLLLGDHSNKPLALRMIELNANQF